MQKSVGKLLSDPGTVHQTSNVHRPQQNGMEKRKHRHLLNVARALHFQTNLPIQFCRYSLLTATYLLNRIPSFVLNYKTPFELMGVSPTYTHIRTYRCLCFATDSSAHNDKFAPRFSKCLFTGYFFCNKAYRLYNLHSHQVFDFRYVISYETVFPFFIY